jgi:excisionase family DNA binding protein
MEILSWLTVPQAAQRLGVTKVTAYSAIAAGRLDVVKTPLGLLVDPKSVDAYARVRCAARHKSERQVVGEAVATG